MAWQRRALTLEGRWRLCVVLVLLSLVGCCVHRCVGRQQTAGVVEPSLAHVPTGSRPARRRRDTHYSKVLQCRRDTVWVDEDAAPPTRRERKGKRVRERADKTQRV